MKKILLILFFLSLTLIICGCNNNVEVTYISATETEVVRRSKFSKIKKSGVPFEQEINILGLYEDFEFTKSCLGNIVKEDMIVFVDVNWGPDYVLSNEQKAEVDENVYKKYSLEKYDFYYFGTYHDMILFNINCDFCDGYLDGIRYNIMNGKYADSSFDTYIYVFKVECLYDGKIYDFGLDGLYNNLTYKEKNLFISKYANFEVLNYNLFS